jgi:hypothetical protein
MADDSAYGRTKLDKRIAPDDNTDLDSGIDMHGLMPKLDDDATHFLNAQGALVAIPTLSYDWNYFRRAGDDAWYSSPCTAVSYMSATTAANMMYASLFIVPKTITLDRIAVYVTDYAVGNAARLGIYNDGANMYPGTLLLDAGAVAIATLNPPLRSIVINQQLTVGLYWLVCLFNAILTGARGTRHDHTLPYFGRDLSVPNLQQSHGWSVAQAYGALPDPFTGGGVMSGDSIARVTPFVRLSVA